jgi:hypothetical protein
MIEIAPGENKKGQLGEELPLPAPTGRTNRKMPVLD